MGRGTCGNKAPRRLADSTVHREISNISMQKEGIGVPKPQFSSRIGVISLVHIDYILTEPMLTLGESQLE